MTAPEQLRERVTGREPVPGAARAGVQRPDRFPQFAGETAIARVHFLSEKTRGGQEDGTGIAFRINSRRPTVDRKTDGIAGNFTSTLSEKDRAPVRRTQRVIPGRVRTVTAGPDGR
jgi:hypothetical protein